MSKTKALQGCQLIQAINTLGDKGNNVQELNLASSGAIPENADLIVIAGATRKLLAAEVSSLQKYLQAGGNLLLMLIMDPVLLVRKNKHVILQQLMLIMDLL